MRNTMKYVVLFGILVAFLGVVEAKVLYYDNFDGSAGVNLHGLAPDIRALNPTATWTAYSGWKADGSIAGLRSCATLPFTPQSGKVYQLTASFSYTATSAVSEKWLGMGFATGSSTSAGNDHRFSSGGVLGNPWMQRVDGVASGLTYSGITYTGSGPSGAAAFTGSWNTAVVFRIILDTRAAIWKVTYYSRNLADAAFTLIRKDDWPANPTIVTVGIVNNDLVSKFNSFSLEEMIGDSDPAPTYAQTDVNLDTEKVSWNASTLENLTGYYLYMVANEPNFVDAAPTLIAPAVGRVEADMPLTLLTNNIYYWRVDNQINNSAPVGDPNTVAGLIWYFESQKTLPVFTTQPVVQFVALNDTATFTVVVSSPTEVTYQWYYSTDNIATPGTDTPVGGNAAVLNVSGVVTNEGYYYCKATNNDGQAISSMVGLIIKRMYARYNFENDPNDSSPWTPDFNGSWVNGGAYTTGIVGTNAAAFNNSRYVNINVAYHPLDPNLLDPRYASIGWWFKGTSTATMAVTGVADSALPITNNTNNLQLQINDGGAGWVRLYLRSAYNAPNPGAISFAAKPSTVNLLDNNWHHVAVTWDIGPRGIGAKMYVDGTLFSYFPARLDLAFHKWTYKLYVGARNNRGPSASPIANGCSLDDVQFYNYPLDKYGVLDMFLEGPANSVCSDRPVYDISGPAGLPNCVVDLYDFAAGASKWLAGFSLSDLEGLASEWLDCGVYPDCF